MAIFKAQPVVPSEELSSKSKGEKPLCAQDRLLNALKASPRLSHEDAETINAIVREAREGSLTDELYG